MLTVNDDNERTGERKKTNLSVEWLPLAPHVDINGG